MAPCHYVCENAAEGSSIACSTVRIHYQKRLNKYVHRMADDMKLRKYAQSTIDVYT